MSELNRFIQARNWMKSNQNFLKTWHAHTGYKLHLFDTFSKSLSVNEAAEQRNLDKDLLNRWIEVGLEIGHLKKSLTGKIKAKKKMVKYASAASEESVGILLREMMELHIPVLLEYPRLLEEGERLSYLEDKFDDVVAETSELLEKAAVSPVRNIVNKEKPLSVIDLGCGYGGYLKAIHDKYPEIKLQGVEISRKVADKASAKLGKDVPVHCGDMVEFIDKFEDRVDMVMAHNLIYYFPYEERPYLYKRIAGILNKKGTVTFITPVTEAKYGRQFTAAFNTFMTAHKNLFPLPTLNEIKEQSGTAGFKVVNTKPLIREGGWYLITLKKIKH